MNTKVRADMRRHGHAPVESMRHHRHNNQHRQLRMIIKFAITIASTRTAAPAHGVVMHGEPGRMNIILRGATNSALSNHINYARAQIIMV